MRMEGWNIGLIRNVLAGISQGLICLGNIKVLQGKFGRIIKTNTASLPSFADNLNKIGIGGDIDLRDRHKFHRPKPGIAEENESIFMQRLYWGINDLFVFGLTDAPLFLLDKFIDDDFPAQIDKSELREPAVKRLDDVSIGGICCGFMAPAMDQEVAFKHFEADIGYIGGHSTNKPYKVVSVHFPGGCATDFFVQKLAY